MKPVCFAFMALLVVAGCNHRDREIEKEVLRIKERSIALPTCQMLLFEHNRQTEPQPISSKMKLVVYVDSTACSSCALDNLYHWDDLSSALVRERTDVALVFVFSPKRGKFGEFKKKILWNSKTYPLYVDTCGIFSRLNPHIPTNPALHTFLLDEHNKVLLVGDPAKNKKVRELLWEVIEKNRKKAKTL